MIDLHTHSTFSDGTLKPAELVRLAGRCGLTALALTDHDCTSGIDEFIAAGSELEAGLKLVPGVEISANVDSGTMHMLGYFIDCEHASLQRILAQIRGGREARNARILERLNELGLDLTWDEVAAHAGEDVVGRPHFAQALVARGHVTGKQDAFDRYLAKGQAAYVDRFRLSPEDSIAAIAGAGGVPVLAHPFSLGLAADALRERIGELAEMGLQGVEAYYSEHTPEQTRGYVSLAADLGLAVSGGSDFHGANNPDIRLGRGFGSLHVPDEVIRYLEEKVVRRAACG